MKATAVGLTIMNQKLSSNACERPPPSHWTPYQHTLWLHRFLHNQQFFKYITLKSGQRRSLQPLRVDTLNNPPWPPHSRSSQRAKTANKCGTTRVLTTMQQTHTWRSWENLLWSAGKLHTCTLLQQLLHLKVISYLIFDSSETTTVR